MRIFNEENDDQTNFELLGIIADDTPPTDSPAEEANASDSEESGDGVVSVSDGSGASVGNDSPSVSADEAKTGEDTRKAERERVIKEIKNDGDGSDYDFDYIDGTISGRSAKIPEKIKLDTDPVFLRIQAVTGVIFGVAAGLLVCVLIYYGYINLFTALCAAAFIVSIFIVSTLHIVGRVISGIAAGGRFAFARLGFHVVRMRGGKLNISRIGRGSRFLDVLMMRKTAVIPPSGERTLSLYLRFYCGGVIADLIVSLIFTAAALILSGSSAVLAMSMSCAAYLYTLVNFIPRFSGLSPREGLIILSLLSASPSSVDMIRLDAADIALMSGQRPSELAISDVVMYKSEYIPTAESEIRHSTIGQAEQLRLPIGDVGNSRAVALLVFFSSLPDYFYSVAVNIKRFFARLFAPKSKPSEPTAEASKETAADTVEQEAVEQAVSEEATVEEAAVKEAAVEESAAVNTAAEPIIETAVTEAADVEEPSEDKAAASSEHKAVAEEIISDEADIDRIIAEETAFDAVAEKSAPETPAPASAETPDSSVSDAANVPVTETTNTPVSDVSSQSASDSSVPPIREVSADDAPDALRDAPRKSAPEPKKYQSVVTRVIYIGDEEAQSPYHALISLLEYYRALDNPKKLERLSPERDSCERLALELENSFDYLPGIFRERVACELCSFYSFNGNIEAARGFYGVSQNFPTERGLTSTRSRAFFNFFIKNNRAEALKLVNGTAATLNVPNNRAFHPYSGILKMESELLEYIKNRATEPDFTETMNAKSDASDKREADGLDKAAVGRHGE